MVKRYCDFCGCEISRERDNFGMAIEGAIRDRKIFSKYITKKRFFTEVCSDCGKELLSYIDEIEKRKELTKLGNHIKTNTTS